MGMIVLDVDGVLINNKIVKIFNNIELSLWINKKPWLKRLFLRIFEIIEAVFVFCGFQYESNAAFIDFLADMKVSGDSKFFILTDRSLLGIKNIQKVLKMLNLDEKDIIQIRDYDFLQSDLEILRKMEKTALCICDKQLIRGREQEIWKEKNKRLQLMREKIGLSAKIILSSAVKSNLKALAHLKKIAEFEEIKILIDDNSDFLENAAAKPFYFKTFDVSLANMKMEEASDMIVYFIQKKVCRQ